MMCIIKIQHIDCYVNEVVIMQLSTAIVDCYVIYDGPIDMQIWALSLESLIVRLPLMPMDLSGFFYLDTPTPCLNLSTVPE